MHLIFKENMKMFNEMEMNGKKIETCSGLEAFKRIPQSKLIELKKRLFPQS